MNENNEINNNLNRKTTENINTMINTNEVNVNNALNTNFQNNNQNMIMSGFNNFSNNQNNINNPNLLNNNINSNLEEQNKKDVQNEQILHDTTNVINKKPVQKKKKKSSININPELKFSIILMLVLLIAIMFIPTIFDLIDDLKIKIFS